MKTVNFMNQTAIFDTTSMTMLLNRAIVSYYNAIYSKQLG